MLSSKDDKKLKKRLKKNSPTKNKSPPKLMMSQQLAMVKIDYTKQESTSRKELDYAIQNIHSIVSGEDDNLPPKKSEN